MLRAPANTILNARRLRREMTPPEARLWMALRRKVADGLKFRRQHPVGPYVLDFYCDGAKLAVEVDGFAHLTGDHPERDSRRDAWLAARGVRTLRIDAREVRDELDGVVGLIVAVARSHSV
ncbi:MAG TPA: endonuclease domain-containing protein [Caulobacteraceae bacterium]|jgi:very-short-patch-repair endonuclease